jgi:hypothetical protein
VKSTSGISRNDAALGSTARLLLLAFFIALLLQFRCSSSADDPYCVPIQVDADHEQNPSGGRRPDCYDSWFAMLPIGEEEYEWVIENRRTFLERDAVLSSVRGRLKRGSQATLDTIISITLS